MISRVNGSPCAWHLACKEGRGPTMQQLSWIFASLSLALLLGAGVLLWRTQSAKKRPLPTEWALTARPVFSVEERRVYRQLHEALPHHIILSKLPLVRFCQATDPDRVRYWFELLGSTNVSFAICSLNGNVLAAIDLETERGGSRLSQQIKQAVLAASKVRYVRCAAESLPSLPELQQLVPQSIPVSRGPQTAPAVSEARDHLATTLANKRRERSTPKWADSGFMQDSFFGTDAQGDSASVSSFTPLRSVATVGDLRLRPSEANDLDSEPSPSALRH